MVSRTLQSQTYCTQCTGHRRVRLQGAHGHCRVRLHGAQNTAESDYLVSRTLQSKITQCTGHRRVRLQGAHCTLHSTPQSQITVCTLHTAQHTAESDYTVHRTPQSQILLCFSRLLILRFSPTKKNIKIVRRSVVSSPV